VSSGIPVLYLTIPKFHVVKIAGTIT
jgi:hypothetical protein